MSSVQHIEHFESLSAKMNEKKKGLNIDVILNILMSAWAQMNIETCAQH